MKQKLVLKEYDEQLFSNNEVHLVYIGGCSMTEGHITYSHL